MTAILSSAHALYQAVGGVFTSARELIGDFAAWLFGQPITPVDATTIAGRLDTELCDMAAIIEERNTNWVSLATLFGEHKTTAKELALALEAAQARVNEIYKYSKKASDLTEDEKSEVDDISQALKQHITTLEEAKNLFPTQYQAIQTAVAKIIDNAHHLRLSSDEVAKISGEPQFAAQELVAAFERLSQRAEGIYKTHRKKDKLPTRALLQLQEIQQQVQNRLGIANTLRKDYPEIESALLKVAPFTAEFDATKSLLNMPRGYWSQFPRFVQSNMIENRLREIQKNLSDTLEDWLENLNDHSIDKETKDLITEAKHLKSRYEMTIRPKIFVGNYIESIYEGSKDSKVIGLNELLESFQAAVNTEQAVKRVEELIDGAFERVADTVRGCAQSFASLVTETALRIIPGGFLLR